MEIARVKFNRPRRAQERYMEDGHAADRANIQKQTVQNDWRGLSCTRKIKEEALQKNEVDKTGRGGHRMK